MLRIAQMSGQKRGCFWKTLFFMGVNTEVPADAPYPSRKASGRKQSAHGNLWETGGLYGFPNLGTDHPRDTG